MLVSYKETVVILPGDGYKRELINNFVDYLKLNNLKVIFIQLLENHKDCSYSDLEVDNYMDYINSQLRSERNPFILYSISKGCHWARVYATKYPSRVKRLVMVEPTTMSPQLLRQFEKERGNFFIDKLYKQKAPFKNIDSETKSLDVLVSTKHSYIPKHTETIVVYTSRNNEDMQYSWKVIGLKNEFLHELKHKGMKHLYLVELDSNHCVDLYHKNFEILTSILLNPVGEISGIKKI